MLEEFGFFVIGRSRRKYFMKCNGKEEASRLNVVDRSHEHNDEIRDLALTKLKGVFRIIFAGLSASVVLFLLEFIVHALRKLRQSQRNDGHSWAVKIKEHETGRIEMRKSFAMME